MVLSLRKFALAALFICLSLGYSFGQFTTNLCPGVTITATTSSPMTTMPDCAAINLSLINGGWDGGQGSGFIRFNWVSAISSVRIEFHSVNTDDYATITTNSGGALTITPINGCSPVSGVIVGPYTGGGSFGYGTTAYNVSSTIPFTMLNLQNTGASSGWVCDCPVNVILATDLDYLAAKYDGEGAVLLDWQTTQESNSSHFVVERSADGNEWESVGEVKAAGNSDRPTPYHLSDGLPISGKSMYRLLAYDVDGSHTQSGVQSVFVDDYIKVFPTMSNGMVNVIGVADASSLKLYNHLGMSFDVSASGTASGQRLDLSQLQAGMYILRLETQGKVLSRKIWKI